MIPLYAVFLLAVIVPVLLYPLGQRKRTPLSDPEEALRDETLIAQSFEKENIVNTLSQLEVENAQGKLTAEDYTRLKRIEERRLLTLLDTPPAASPESSVPPTAPAKRSWGIIFALGVWTVAGTVAISSLVHKKIEKDQRAENVSAPQAGSPPINPEQMVARLRARLGKNPNDLQGQMMLGRSYMVLERWKEAEGAWQAVLRLDERNSTAHVALGEMLLRSHAPGDKSVAQEALAHFDKALIVAPQSPSILWARGIALVALGRFPEADESWTTAYRTLTPGTPEANMLKDALEALRSGKIAPNS